MVICAVVMMSRFREEADPQMPEVGLQVERVGKDIEALGADAPVRLVEAEPVQVCRDHFRRGGGRAIA